MKYILIALGAVLTFNGIRGVYTANLNTGAILVILAGILCLILGIFFKRIMKKIPKEVKAAVGTLVVLLLGFCVFLGAYGSISDADYNENVLIVLGSGVNGETPTRPLVNRLDKAVEYYEKNPDVTIIVTGGQGPQEDITEAEAMERYLISKNIPKEKIIKEDKATSTSENYKFSKKIIDENFENPDIVTITNVFHIYRSKRLALLAGLETKMLGARTPLSAVPSSYLREILAVFKLWIFKY